jgi:SAM-dependent methyltransferase
MTDPTHYLTMHTPDTHSPCPLCSCSGTTFFFEDRHRSYLQCTNCSLIFVPPEHHFATQAEKATYDLHENSPDDPGYRRFLSRLTTPLLALLRPGLKGLDFGCGPGPALAAMLTEQGYAMDLYDPFYHDDPLVFTRQYDFICATEVVEHLRNPGREFERLFSMLRPGGVLGIMTKLAAGRERFADWHYIRDLTHICFYGQATFTYIAEKYGAELDLIGSDVVLLHKKWSPPC